MKTLFKKFFLIVAITAGLYAVWYWPLTISLIKPTALRIIAPKAQAENINLENNTLSYPRLGITAPVDVYPNSSPLDVRDWSSISTSLKRGVSLNFTNSSFSDSNFSFITGHSSDTYPHKYSTVFAALGQAKEGDIIYLKINNILNTFTVKSKDTLNPNNNSSFKSLQNNTPSNTHEIALVTCWPPPTTINRLVVIATLN